MTPTFHPRLVNGRFGDPALFVEILHRREALLFDLGDLSPLSARDLLRVSHVFVSHMHIDHFVGFDALLRVSVGREKCIRVHGPPGICDRFHHKLQAYEWDLVERYEADLQFDVMEISGEGVERAARFRFKNRFAWEEREAEQGALAAKENGFQVEPAVLEHHGPCLGFALSEPAHANVWKNRLDERGLAPGAWLQELKGAILGHAGDDRAIPLPGGGSAPLGELRDLVSVSAGQKIVYVTDIADSPHNRERVSELAGGADTLFIEARFSAEDAQQALDRAHLTTGAAGEIARAAGVRRVEPFHFSPRYEGGEQRMIDEVMSAFTAADVAQAERFSA